MAEKPVAMPPHMAAQCTPPIRPASRAAPSMSQSIGIALRGRGLAVRTAGRRCIVAEDVDRRGVEVFELALADRPDEGGDHHQQEHDADRDQYKEDVHAAVLPFRDGVRARRRALHTTSSEDSAMPSAASQGVTRPAIATGRAMTL